MKKIRKDTDVLSSSSAIASPPQVAAIQTQTTNAGDQGDEDEAKDEEATTKHEAGDSEEDLIPDPLSPSSRKVRHLGVKGQYERKARNVTLKINKSLEIITANRAGKLVVNGQAVPDSNFALLFRSVFSRTHDMEQPGVNQFLGALRQIGVQDKELRGRVVQEAYGSQCRQKGMQQHAWPPFADVFRQELESVTTTTRRGPNPTNNLTAL